MELIEVDAAEDRTRVEGGHAVILLRGVTDPPENVRFLLRPMDDEGLAAEARHLFERQHEPLAVTVTEDGIVLSVGPELAGSPFLLPGTAMEIILAEPHVRGEFLWPAITPPVRAKRRNIMTKRAPGDPLAVPPRSAPAASPQLPAPVDEPVGSPTASGLASSSPADTFVFSNLTIGAAQAAIAAAESMASVPPPLLSQAPPPFQAPERAAEITVEPPPQPTALANQAPGRKSIVVTTAAPRKPEAVQPARPAGTKFEAAAGDVPRATSEPMVQGKSTAAIAPQPQETSASVRPPPRTEQPTLAATAQTQDQARSVPRTFSAPSVAAATAALLIVGSFAGLRAFDLTVAKRKPTSAAPAIASPVVSASSSRSVYEVIAAGPRSPRGTIADTVSPAKALQLAHALLHGPEVERDPEEAIYWLKRYLASTAGTEHARIALTQLGSAYAEPVRGARDLESARIAWELAGALGDPVAMCFLAAVHERGLGVAANASVAASWYMRAAAAGGTCASGAGPGTKDGG